MEINNIYLGDCLELMKDIKDKSIDMILCDLPYGTTACKWDIIIPLDKLWKQYNRIIKGNGAICLFSSQPFTSVLISSNLKMYKYDWIWIKDKATGHLNCKKQPMRKYETISVFYKKQCIYNPQFKEKHKKNIRPVKKRQTQTELYNLQNNLTPRNIPNNITYPNNLLCFNGLSGVKGRLHPAQKPVALLEYLIKTYTNENELVLDNCMGVGSTCVACLNTNRNYIGIEKDEKYFEIAKSRIKTFFI